MAKFRTRLSFTKTGLVCSGGATKAAAFHIGVCLALRDKGFSFIGGKADDPAPPDSLPYPRIPYQPHQIHTYVGSSAGALICTFLAAGISIESIINSFTKDAHFKIPGDHAAIPKISYRDMLAVHWPKPSHLMKSFKRNSFFARTLESMLMRNLRLPGLFSTRGLADYLRQHILPVNRFNELKADLFVVGTRLDHSRKIIFGRYSTEKTIDNYSQYTSTVPISDAVGASMALPPIYVPYPIVHPGGKVRYYIDGEIRETLSTHVAKDNLCDLLICSYTHQPYHYKEEIGSLYDYGISAILIQTVYQAIEQKVYGSKKLHESKVLALKTIREFFLEKKYPEADLQELATRLQQRLEFNEALQFIFIHPEPRDREMFFGDHFTLDSRTLQNVVTIGYKRAMTELRKYEFAPIPSLA